MTNRPIIVGMAAAFAGLTALLLVAGVVVNPLLLAVAVPFGAVTYLLWYHASGRLRDRIRREAAGASATERARARQRARAAEHRRSAYDVSGGGAGRREAAGGVGGAGDRSATGDPRDRAPSTDRMSPQRAYDVLGVDPAADEGSVRDAYREKAKRLHPDTEGGDEEAFKRLTEAYEVAKR
ncbi:hypothetical protein JCM17823_20870 [Halorubrum gandharaense]